MRNANPKFKGHSSARMLSGLLIFKQLCYQLFDKYVSLTSTIVNNKGILCSYVRHCLQWKVFKGTMEKNRKGVEVGTYHLD